MIPCLTLNAAVALACRLHGTLKRERGIWYVGVK